MKRHMAGRRRQIVAVAAACASTAACLAVASLSGNGAIVLEARSSPGVGWAGARTGWAGSDGGSPGNVVVKGEGKTRGERRGLDGEWMGLPSNKAYYADGWNAGAPDKYWYSTCSRENGCSGENLPQNVAERTDDYDDGWDRRQEPVPRLVAPLTRCC